MMVFTSGNEADDSPSREAILRRWVSARENATRPPSDKTQSDRLAEADDRNAYEIAGGYENPAELIASVVKDQKRRKQRRRRNSFGDGPASF